MPVMDSSPSHLQCNIEPMRRYAHQTFRTSDLYWMAGGVTGPPLERVGGERVGVGTGIWHRSTWCIQESCRYRSRLDRLRMRTCLIYGCGAAACLAVSSGALESFLRLRCCTRSKHLILFSRVYAG